MLRNSSTNNYQIQVDRREYQGISVREMDSDVPNCSPAVSGGRATLPPVYASGTVIACLTVAITSIQ